MVGWLRVATLMESSGPGVRETLVLAEPTFSCIIFVYHMVSLLLQWTR